MLFGSHTRAVRFAPKGHKRLLYLLDKVTIQLKYVAVHDNKAPLARQGRVEAEATGK